MKTQSFFIDMQIAWRKLIKSWKIEKEDFTWASNFKDIVVEGLNYLSSLSKEDFQATMA
jgi:hypothetical protein